MDRIPILKMGQFLLVSIQVDMHDKLALTLHDDLTDMIVRTQAKGVLIDISALEIVDSFIGRMLANIAAMARILDAKTVVTGMQPSVAITLVELGLTLNGIRTALSVERGMNLLQQEIENNSYANANGDERLGNERLGNERLGNEQAAHERSSADRDQSGSATMGSATSGSATSGSATSPQHFKDGSFKQ